MGIIKKKSGICDDCKAQCDMMGVEAKEKLLYSKNLCQYHYRNRQAVKQQSKKGIFKIRDEIKRAKDVPPKKKRGSLPRRQPSGEGAFFKEIWLSDRPKVSFLTGRPLSDQNDARAFFFAHVLPKSKYPKFRLNPENIIYLEFEEHRDWDFRRHTIEDDPDWYHIIALEEDLKAEYKELYGK